MSQKEQRLDSAPPFIADNYIKPSRPIEVEGEEEQLDIEEFFDLAAAKEESDEEEEADARAKERSPHDRRIDSLDGHLANYLRRCKGMTESEIWAHIQNAKSIDTIQVDSGEESEQLNGTGGEARWF